MKFLKHLMTFPTINLRLDIRQSRATRYSEIKNKINVLSRCLSIAKPISLLGDICPSRNVEIPSFKEQRVADRTNEWVFHSLARTPVCIE